MPAVLVISALWIIFIIYFAGLKLQLRSLRRQLESRISAPVKKPLALEMQDNDLKAMTAALNQIFRQDEEFRQLQKRNENEYKDLITNISHDLRTPLTAVCGYLDLLEQEDLSENAARCISVIRGRTDNLKQLTEELFGYSLPMSAEQALPLEEVVLNRALEESILAHYAALKGRRISPEITMPKEPVTCRLNRTALFRILENMLCNAMKYSDGDLKITLTRRGEITFANHAKRLGEVDAQKLFDRLYTVETGTKSTGLGLSIARLLTEQMHGTASARYADGILFICLQFDVI